VAALGHGFVRFYPSRRAEVIWIAGVGDALRFCACFSYPGQLNETSFAEMANGDILTVFSELEKELMKDALRLLVR
jgi:hypothetical protein